MYRYFVELAYHGGSYCGWQVQPNGISVQEKLEQALCILLQKKEIRITGAGRTDAGVHASYFVAHFDSSIDNLHEDNLYMYKLNRLLPCDIAIHRIRPVSATAHARFDALSRTYHYKIATRKNPFNMGLAYHFYRPLDVEKMNNASEILKEYRDFTSFSKLHGNAKTNLCEVSEAYWVDDEKTGELTFIISANRFLRNMVRAIVGTMIDIGLGKIPSEALRPIIEGKCRGLAGTSVPPQGLYLTRIDYPDSIFHHE